MKKHNNNRELLSSFSSTDLLPSISVDCVILTFHENEIKILLNKFDIHSQWMLPGGFVYRNENLEEAAYNILFQRTKLKNCYLKQFHTFGNKDRTKIEENRLMLEEYSIDSTDSSHWFLQRFVSVGYYAFVNYDKVRIGTIENEDCKWFGISGIPQLYGDHNKIIDKALRHLRMVISHAPLVLELLPERFTISELRIVYETILNRKIDRRNFQRKLIFYDLVYKLDEVSKKWGVKDTTLFSFNKQKYMDALENGLSFF